VRTTLSKLSPEGTAESSPGRSPGNHAHNDEKSRKGRLKVNQVVPRTASWVIFSRPGGTGPSLESLPRTASWAALSCPSGTKSVNGGFSHTPFSPSGAIPLSVRLRAAFGSSTCEEDITFAAFNKADIIPGNLAITVAFPAPALRPCSGAPVAAVPATLLWHVACRCSRRRGGRGSYKTDQSSGRRGCRS
jgi:hypothetical protein